jgi:hypothetical protein
VIWPSKVYAEAIWASNLKPAEKLVALAYADHARGKRQVWLSYRRLMERTGYSRAWCAEAVRVLRDAGWLTVVEKGHQHHSTVYELTTPTLSSPDSGVLSESRSPVNGVPVVQWGGHHLKTTYSDDNSQYLEATAKAQRRESTSQLANAAFSPGES